MRALTKWAELKITLYSLVFHLYTLWSTVTKGITFYGCTQEPMPILLLKEGVWHPMLIKNFEMFRNFQVSLILYEYVKSLA